MTTASSSLLLQRQKQQAAPRPLKVEETPLLAVCFTTKAKATNKDANDDDDGRLIALVERRLEAEGLIVLARHDDRDCDDEGKARQVKRTFGAATIKTTSKRVILVLSATQEALEEEAEEIHLVKRTRRGVMDRFSVARRSEFLLGGDDLGVGHKGINGIIFSPNEVMLLVERIFEHAQVLAPDDIEGKSELSELLEGQYHLDSHRHMQLDSGQQRRLSVRSRQSLEEFQERQSDYLAHVLRASGLIDDVVPIHLPTTREVILHDTCWPWYRIRPPIDAIQQYYGWSIGFYFAFVGFVTAWLVFPAIIGMFFFALRWYRNDTIDEDEYTPFYGIIVFFWSVVFLCYWEREEKRLSFRWGTYSLSDYERRKLFADRPGFTGYLRISPVTGKPEVHYSSATRRIKYLGSAVVSAALLLVAFYMMILSLNLQGYIRPMSNPTRWTESYPHPFHYPRLAVLSEEGQLFDAKSWWRGFLPVGIHVACIFTLNSLYRIVAEALTEWENHENQLSHNNSLVLKRFLFEAFDCYIPLFFLAFYERDVERLNAELVLLFQSDTIRRVVMESVIPMVLHKLFPKPDSSKGRSQLRRRDMPSLAKDRVLEELDLDKYEDFDDCMEM